jgi:hypothetical protein
MGRKKEVPIYGEISTPSLCLFLNRAKEKHTQKKTWEGGAHLWRDFDT